MSMSKPIIGGGGCSTREELSSSFSMLRMGLTPNHMGGEWKRDSSLQELGMLGRKLKASGWQTNKKQNNNNKPWMSTAVITSVA